MSSSVEGHGRVAAEPPSRRSPRLTGAGAAPAAPSATDSARKLNAQPQHSLSDKAAEVRREFAVLLGEFRRTPVLVPLTTGGGLCRRVRRPSRGPCRTGGYARTLCVHK
ncbi:hypothetical protein GCM10010249_26260 [Streptomyces roseolilacinus]|uniref:Uncharacterized protein n=1 Tax=Streptomyces roseolilacinus TaxID=66904 RepID=A0A918AZG5_9ACTN|nr:hypothetical protein GCM10010249_26260 [Streptomyces roseolilacinus]